MRKSDRKWPSLMALITTLFLPACNSRDRILERNENPLAPAYTNFQELNEKYESEDFEVKLICEAQGYPNPIRAYPTVNKQWIVRADEKKNEETKLDKTYYKIAEKGNVIDTLFLKGSKYWPEFVENFMVFTSAEHAYYTTWPLNGDTTKHEFKVLNADLTWNTEKVDSHIKAAKTNAKYWFVKDVREEGKNYLKLHYYQDKTWQILWQQLTGYHSVRDHETASRYSEEIFRSGDAKPYLPDNVTLLHFHPLEKMSYRHNIGGGDPGFSVINWRGKAFFSTKISGKDFRFFQSNIAVENEKFDGHKNRFYSILGPGASSIIFTPFFYMVPDSFAFYTSQRNTLYIIKRKQAVNNIPNE